MSNASLVVKSQHRFEATLNPALYKRDKQGRVLGLKSNWDHLTDFTSSANGSFRCLQLLERVTKFATLVLQRMGSSMAVFCGECAGKMGGWTLLGIPRLVSVVPKAAASFVAWVRSPRASDPTGKREQIERVHDIADGVATLGHVSGIFVKHSGIKRAADVFTLVSDVTDLTMASADWRAAKEHIAISGAGVSGDAAVHNRLTHAMRYAFIKMVKAVCSVFSGVVGFMAIAVGGPVLSSTTLLCIGLGSTIAALVAHFYVETAPYEKVDFFKIRQPEVLMT